MQRGLREDRGIVAVGKWIYGGCPSQDLECAFERLSQCERDTDEDESGPRSEDSDTAGGEGTDSGWTEEERDRDRAIRVEEYTWIDRAIADSNNMSHASDHGRVAALDLPELAGDPWAMVADDSFSECHSGVNGMFYFVSSLVGWLFKPNRHMLEEARRVLQTLGLPAAYIGVHVRHGDACFERERCLPFSSFADAIRNVSVRYSLSHVYLASDDAVAYQRLRALLPESLSLHWNSETDRAFLAVTDEDLAGGWDGVMVERKLQRAKAAEREVQLRGIMVDTMLLSASAVLVGQFSSNLARLALELSTYHKGQTPPYVSLDIPWCWGGSNAISVPGHGDWQC